MTRPMVQSVVCDEIQYATIFVKRSLKKTQVLRGNQVLTAHGYDQVVGHAHIPTIICFGF